MRKLSEILLPEAIILELQSKEKVSVIKELAQILINKNFISDEPKFYEAILARENMESTGIGSGVAIPHARTDSVKNLVLAFGRSQAGIDFSSLDGKPSHLVFLIAAPEDKKSEYIITLARLSRLLKREEIRFELGSAKTVEEVLEIIERHE